MAAAPAAGGAGGAGAVQPGGGIGMLLNPNELADAFLQPGNNILNMNYDQLDALRKQKASQQLMTNLLVGLSKQVNGRGVNTGIGRGTQTGLNFMPWQDPSMFNRQLLQPLPFDQFYSRTGNFMALVNSVPPEVYRGNEEVLEQLKQMTPEAVRALDFEDSLYKGVPDNFYINRFQIALQRKREDDVYAFK